MAFREERVTFNRGLISPLALARKDLERPGISAETYTNWMPRNLGSMMLRPGTGYIGNSASNNKAKYIPFIYSADDKALIEITDSKARVWVDDALVTRPSVSTTVTDGDFDVSGITDWTSNDESGATSDRIIIHSPTVSLMTLRGTGNNAAIRTQEVTVAAADQNVEHSLKVVVGILDRTQASNQVYHGEKVTLRVGSTDGDDDYVTEISLDNGSHHFSFTPAGNFWIQFSNRNKNYAYVQSCKVESSGTLSLDGVWSEADLPNIRYDQSGDVVYVACSGVAPMKILRYSSDSKSWGIGYYEPQDGPLDLNTRPVTMTPNTITGLVNITASLTNQDFWKDSDVGRLIRIDSNGQSVQSSIGADATWTDPIRVTGTVSARIFTITISGTWTTTVELHRSMTDPDVSASWSKVAEYTTNQTLTYDDGLDNQTAWYRIGFDAGWDSGTAILSLDYGAGSISGYARIYNISSPLVAQVITLKDFGGTDASPNWYFSSWGEASGYPSTVSFSEGRLGWFGQNKAWLSISDAYEGFDIETEGDSGPITRTIASGSVDSVNWALSLRRLLLGTDTREHVIRSSSEDEPLTPSNAALKDIGTQGSASVLALKNDKAGLFVQRGGAKLMEIVFGSEFEYGTSDLTAFNPAIGKPGITHIAIQRQPDTRVHCVRSDGTVAVLLHDRAEEVSCWIELTAPGTDAAVEDVVVLPGADGTGEDSVYYSVKRTVDGSTVRFLEKWSLESECQGGTTNKQMDAHIAGTVSGGLMTGLTHLEGETVAVWSNGKDVGTYAVSGGQITGVTEDGSAIAGLPYTAQWQSAKLGDLTQRKNISDLSVILYNTHYQGLKYGPNFTDLDDLPQTKDGTVIPADTVHSDLDQPSFSFDGHWDSDARLCLQAASPRPCTLLAVVMDLEG